ncbi:MAG: hypothetical protein B5M56_11070 [Desulfococcus sp. 4484_241]|nr:MAG: hypothetical protein B5M56_11070 [Desulfococcus sp. 4484_241]
MIRNRIYTILRLLARVVQGIIVSVGGIFVTCEKNIELSVVITVYSETVSLVETVERLLAQDRGYIREVILVVSPFSSADCMAVCGRLSIEQTGCDVVVANRWLPGGGFSDYNPVKLVLNWLFQHIFRIVYATRIGDLTFGLKILARDVIDAINWESRLHEIFIETTVKPVRYGYTVEQVPTFWRGRKEGRSRNSFFINLRYVWMAIRVRLAPVPERYR